MAGDAALYGLLGLRVEGSLDGAGLALRGRYGQGADSTDGRWLEGDASLFTGTRIGPLGARLMASAFGLRYLDPFTYDAGGGTLRPALSLARGDATVTVTPRLDLGRWATDLREGSLRVSGGSLELRRATGAIVWIAAADAFDVDNGVTAGVFAGWTGGATARLGAWTARADIRGQRTPLESELGGGVVVAGAVVEGVELRLEARRTLRDPLFGTPGSVTASIGVSVRPFVAAAAAPPPVVRVEGPAEGGRRVRFALRAPDAERVELTGDFTEWRPVAMTREGEHWIALLTLPPGLHHFGFLVDGSWAIPADAPGVVDDGWGRRNASVVIEP